MAEPSHRFLVIRLSSIGDIVHALPAVAALGKTFPEAEITWVVETRYACLLDGNPFVRRVVKLDTLGWRRSLISGATVAQMSRGLSTLRAVLYDAAIDFQGLIKSGVIARLSHSRRRVGFSKSWLREPAARIFYTERISPSGRRHVIEWNLSLVESLGARHFTRPDWKFPMPRADGDDHEVERRLAGIDKFIVINPGGGWKAKRWPPEDYAALIRRLVSSFPHQILLTGSPEEETVARLILIQAECGGAQFFPSTIVQLIALARRASLFVGGDTGPVHLAAATGTPVVAIYGADPWNTPERNGPFSAEDIVVVGARPDRLSGKKDTGYLSGVRVEDVFEAICRRLDKARG